MKCWLSVLGGLSVLMGICGCAIDGGYVPRVPHKARFELNEYHYLPENKAFVLAVDPSGNYASGFASEEKTIKAAIEAATRMCNENRSAKGVLTQPVIYAVNERVVFAAMIEQNELSKTKRR